jgi:hypothetical protein
MSDPVPSVLPHEEPLPPRLDMWVAAVFFLGGVAIVVLSLMMPTYREQQGEIYKAPGLVPALHGSVIVLLSLWLGTRAIRGGAFRTGAHPPRPRREGYSNLRLGLAALLCVAFAVGLVSRMPFWLAAAIFVFCFTTLFEWRRGMVRAQRLKRIAIALALAAGTGVFVTLVFERIFLVRLP